MLTDHLRRVYLTCLPTPLEEMPRLREALGGGPRLLIKRDDQIGLAAGGNKTRRLEFLVAEALERGADTLLTAGGPQSNHCRQTAAAAAKMGLRCVLVHNGRPLPRSQWNGNLLLNELFDAEVHWAGERDRNTVLNEVLDALQATGAHPYAIPVFGSVPTGAAADVAAIEELAEQLATRGQPVNRIVFASSSGGTQAGFLVGVKALGLGAKVEGIGVEPVRDLLNRIKDLTVATSTYLGLDLMFSEADFILHETYGEPGYAVVTDAEREAIRLLAHTEGIITDPVYSGRALAGLIDLVRRHVYASDETVLFWHTGGVAGLFARAADVLD